MAARKTGRRKASGAKQGEGTGPPPMRERASIASPSAVPPAEMARVGRAHETRLRDRRPRVPALPWPDAGLCDDSSTRDYGGGGGAVVTQRSDKSRFLSTPEDWSGVELPEPQEPPVVLSLEGDEAERIVVEVTLGQTPTPTSRAGEVFRERVTRQVRAIRAEGKIVDLPGEWPEP